MKMSKKAEVSPAQARLISWKDSFTMGVKSPTDLLDHRKNIENDGAQTFCWREYY
jgi:hypothetical protein